MMDFRSAVLLLLFSVVGWTPDAHAYIDPGTGSILVQGIIAAIAAIGVTLKLYWHRFIGFFDRRSTNEPTTEDPKNSEHVANQDKD